MTLTMYHPAAAGSEFIELYNSHFLAQSLDGFTLVDPDAGTNGKPYYTFASGTSLAAGAFLAVTPTNNLDNSGARIQLRNALGAVMLEIKYSPADPWPKEADGTGHSLVLARPSFGEGDPRAWAASERRGGSPGFAETNAFDPLRYVKINEFLANPSASSGSPRDYIELYNQSAQPIDISGCVVACSSNFNNSYVIPYGTVIDPHGFVSWTDLVSGIGLSQNGEAVYLASPGTNRVLDAIAFRAQANAVSMGRWPDGAPGFQEMATQTPGAANSPPLSRDIVINELMYNPISGSDDDEFIELYNNGSTTTNLSGWSLAGGVTFSSFQSITNFRPGQYIAIARNYTNLAARYPGQLTNGLNLATNNYQGKLGNSGDGVRLLNNSGVVVDEVAYSDGGRWGKWSDGGGSSLELVDARSDNRLAANWADSDSPTQSNWTTISATNIAQLGDSNWTNITVLELALLGAGECLIDNVSFSSPSNSVNLLSNGGFESGTNGWTFEGDYDQSIIATNAGVSGNALLIRAAGRGDYAANRITTSWGTNSLPTGITCRASASVKWLRGNPEVLLRVRGNKFEATGMASLPSNLGTPGRRNSRAVTNTGPAIFEVSHSPVLPSANQTVLVTARARDPDGVTNVLLRYRVDPSSTLTSVVMNDFGTNGDAVGGDGVYSVKIPGQSSGTLVAFRVQATDGFGATNRFPTAQVMYPGDVEQRECLVRFGDPAPPGNFGTYRIWMTAATLNAWITRTKVHNGPLDATFVYGGERAIYNVGAKYSGSLFSSSYYDSPAGVTNCGFSINFPEDDRFLGSTDMALDFASNDLTRQMEQVFHWMADQLELHRIYRRFVHVYVNGVRRGQVYEDTQQPGSDFLEEWYPSDSSGELFKMEVWWLDYNFPLAPIVRQTPYLENSSIVLYLRSGALDVPRYRWRWLKRAGQGPVADYTSLSNMLDAVQTPSATNFISNVESQLNTDEWMRVLALRRIACDFDGYGVGAGHNMYAYRPTAGGWTLESYDVEFAFVASTLYPTQALATGWSPDGKVQNIVDKPVFQRQFWRAVSDAANGPMLSANVNAILDGNAAAFAANNVSAVGPDGTVVIGASNFTARSWISQRRDVMTNALAKLAAPFSITNNNGNNFTTAATSVLLGGKAPMGIAFIKVSGRSTNEIAVWGTLTNWSFNYPLVGGTNAITLLGLDRKSIQSGSTSITITRSP